jgi:FMN phosphatase YigB (HAD superfamily)
LHLIKAITFDLDEVYFSNGKANFLKALEARGVTGVEAKRVFLKSGEMNERYKLGKMFDEEYWSWAAEEWKFDSSPQSLIDLLGACYDVDPKVETMVRKVHEKG